MNLRAKSNINPILCIAFFLLAITSGWALKQVTPVAHFSLVAYSLLLLHSLLSVLLHTHPHSSQTLRNVCVFVSLNTQLVILPLVLADAFFFVQFPVWWIYAIFGLATAAFVAQFLPWDLVGTIASAVSVLFNVVFVGAVALKLEECYWSAGLVSLVLLNHFVLSQLATYYEISRLEIATTCICFLVIFSMNATNEIAAMAAAQLPVRL